MPPIVALIICVVFILCLLRLDQKRSPDVSLVLWIPTIWMFIISGKPLVYWIGVVGETDSSSLDQVFFTLLLCLGLIILFMRHFTWSSVIKENTILFLLVLFMLVSISWSDIPFITFKRWMRELVAVVMALLVLTERDPRQAAESVFRRIVYIHIPLSLLLVKYFTHYGVEYAPWSGKQMWIGVALQKNGLGRLCLIAAFFLIWSLIKKWRSDDIPVVRYQTSAEACVLIITFVLLWGPSGVYSATALASLAAGLAAFVGLLWMKKHRMLLGANTLTVIIALIIVYGIITPIAAGSTIGGITSTLGRDETLTGRTDVWKAVLPIGMQQPILGAGFGGFWTTTAKEDFNITEGHSGYLDVFLDLGLVGLLLFSMFLLSSCRKAQKYLDQDFYWASLWICYLFMAAIHNVAESSLNTFAYNLTAVLLFMAVSSTADTSHPRVSCENCDILQHDMP